VDVNEGFAVGAEGWVTGSVRPEVNPQRGRSRFAMSGGGTILYIGVVALRLWLLLAHHGDDFAK
jgi:hypothetical protein